MTKREYRICQVPGCGRVSATSLYCRGHQNQRRAGRPFTELPRRKRRESDVCKYPDCGRPYYALGYCRPHHSMLSKGVELHAVGDVEFKRESARRPWLEMSPEERSEAMRKRFPNRGRYERTEEWKIARARASMGRKVSIDTPRECVGCGVEFLPAGGNQLWHSGECRSVSLRAKKYGVTRADMDRLIAEHAGKCAICGASRALHVDHDHKTGRVRGLLCPVCNTGLGKFRDDPALLRRATAYLEGG